jgi:hypothetical protein
MSHPPEPAGPRMSAARAVVIGHLVVNGPISLLLLAAAALGWVLLGIVGLPVFMLPAFALAWLWWSFLVPRWRRWALRGGADPHELQTLGQLTGLVWPKGFFLEKTEFRLKDADGAAPPPGGSA